MPGLIIKNARNNDRKYYEYLQKIAEKIMENTKKKKKERRKEYVVAAEQQTRAA